MAKKQINKISDKLAKVNESFSINMYDNGFLIEVSGRDEDDEPPAAVELTGAVSTEFMGRLSDLDSFSFETAVPRETDRARCAVGRRPS
jgi:hypothetical protein